MLTNSFVRIISTTKDTEWASEILRKVFPLDAGRNNHYRCSEPNLITRIPTVICGKTVSYANGIFYRQMNSTNGETVVSFPSIWFIGFSEKMFRHIGVFVALMVFAAALVFVKKYIKDVRGKAVDGAYWLMLAGWCVMTAVKFLPGTRERYDYLAVVFVSFVAVAYRKRIIVPAVIMDLCSCFSCGRLLPQIGEQYYPVAAIAYFVAYCWVTRELWREAKETK